MKTIFFPGNRSVVFGLVWLSLLCAGAQGAELTSVCRADAEADIQQFFSTLQRVHPDLLAKVAVEDYLKLKQQTRTEALGKADTNGQVRVEDLAYGLYYAAAFFHDGHTAVHTQPPLGLDESAIRFPGFFLDYDDGAFVAIAATNPETEGMELLAVDGRPVREFLHPVLDRCSGETETFRMSRFISDQLFWYGFSRLCGSNGSLTLKLRDAKGTESKQQLQTISAGEFRKLASVVAGRKRASARPATQVEFMDGDRIAHFVYPSFILSDEEQKKVESIFQEIRTRKSQDLIIDIRGNGGGNSQMGDYIFSYLYAEKFWAFSKMRLKLSREALSMPGWKEQLPKGFADLEGMVVTFCPEAEAPGPKRDEFFAGHVFLLVNGGTFSSASEFAAMIRDYKVGTIVGSETGGLPVCFGDVMHFTLEHSGIGYGVSYKQFFGPKPRPGDDEHGVLPDIPATRSRLLAYQREADPVLAFTIDHIKQARVER